MRTLLVVALLLAGCVAPAAAPALPPADAPPVLGAIGNSLMLGYNADAEHIEAAPEVAWATGDAPWSFRARLGAAGVENVAAPGAGTDEFLDQVAQLEDAGLVLILLMDSDLCGAERPVMAPTGAFEGELRAGVKALLAKGMQPMLVTPPDITSVAAAARAKPPANDFVLFYASGQACAQEPDVETRQAEMFATIARVAEEEGALHDHGAVARIAWTPEMVSDMDGLHPSLVGLDAIATAVWDAYDAITRTPASASGQARGP
jgi:hypothetical protein